MRQQSLCIPCILELCNSIAILNSSNTFFRCRGVVRKKFWEIYFGWFRIEFGFGPVLPEFRFFYSKKFFWRGYDP